MQHNDEATLVTLVANGSQVTREEKTVFCGRKSVTYGEFYAAIQSGLNPKYIFEFDVDEFESACVTTGIAPNATKHLPTELIYEGCKYNIIRTYEPPTGMIEVTVGL